MRRIDEAQVAFTDIYQRKLWGQGGEGRGIEFELENIYSYVSFIQKFLRENWINSVVEFGCGGWAHLKYVDWGKIKYDGYDVVSSIIGTNNQNYATENIRFHVLSDVTQLPKGDLLIIKTVFQHLPTDDIKYYLGVFKRLYKYLLVTEDIYPDDNTNGDILHGGYRAIRLDLEPFNERCAVLQRMEGSNFGAHWVKHTCLIFGHPDADAESGVVLTNR